MRINKVSLVLGRRGTGKTYYIKKVIRSFLVRMLKVLVVDTLDHPSYAGVKTIQPSGIARMRAGDCCRCWGSDTDGILAACEDFKNGLLVIEDATKFIEGRLQDSVKRLVYDSKQKNVDIIFIFHGFVACPPALFRICDNILMFKTGDTPDVRKNDLPAFEEVVKAHNSVMADKNPYAHKLVNVY